MSGRPLLRIGGVLLLVGAALLPRAWYDALPWGPEMPPQTIKGVTLFQLSLALEGLLLLWLSTGSQLFRALTPDHRPTLAGPIDDPTLDQRRAAWILGAITALALALRLFHVDSDLWLDEIAPVMDYGRMSVLEVIASYQRSNNHLLNTLAVKASVALFGEREWAIRLPALLVGTATVPALYWVARMMQPRRAALGAAALLTVSYHHIFFSQNARGYAGYMLFALLSSGFLVRGLREDRWRDWLLYVVTLYLGFAFQLLTTFVAVAHGLVGLAALVSLRLEGRAASPLLGRLAGVFSVAGLLVFQLYACIIPQALIVARTTYAAPATGFRPFSLEFALEMVRGISAGFGTGLLLGAIPFLLIGAVGFFVLLRRQWAIAAALVLPEVVTAIIFLARGFTFSPRFFLLALPLAMVCAVQGLWSLSELLTRRSPHRERLASRLAMSLVLILCAVSALSLRAYYAFPKQDYRGAIRFIESVRRSSDEVVVFGIAEKGIRFYVAREGVPDDARYNYVRTEKALDSVVTSHPGVRLLFAATFMRDIRINYPALYTTLRSDWPPPHVFPGTVGDGAVMVWTRPDSGTRATR